MKKFIISTLFLSFFSVIAMCQVRFDPGYFINNNGEKITCLIKNTGENDNPSAFKYLMNYKDESQTKNIADVQEFGIGANIKFIRFDIKIDLSSDDQGLLSENSEPEFQNKTVFLKELIKGESSLYLYKKKDITRFFYQCNSNEITQLVYKKYTSQNRVFANKTYQNQLINALNCKKSKLTSLKDLGYNQRDLIGYFIKQNKCLKSDYFTPFEGTSEISKVQINLRAGITGSALNIDYLSGNIFDADFGSETTPHLGIEVELALSREEKKWAVALEPFYESFNKSIMLENSRQTALDEADVKYSAINLSTSLRRYLRVSEKSNIFVNVGLLIGLPFNSIAEIQNVQEFIVDPSLRFSFGIGYNFNDILYIEARQNSSANWSKIPAYSAWFDSRMITLGYRVFHIKG